MADLAHELRCLDIQTPQLPLFCVVHLVVHDIPETELFYSMLRVLNERESSINCPCADIPSDLVIEDASSEMDLEDYSYEDA